MAYRNRNSSLLRYIGAYLFGYLFNLPGQWLLAGSAGWAKDEARQNGEAAGFLAATRLEVRKYAVVYGLLAAIVLYPIAMVRVPGLEDYPNHLARMYILSHYNESEALQRFYEVRWRPIPYLGMDAIDKGEAPRQ